jgi:hypothetical protein
MVARRQQALTPLRLSTRVAAAAAPEVFEPQVAVVLGTQWGDEGKGKLVDILAQQYDIVARAQVRCCESRCLQWPPRSEGLTRMAAAVVTRIGEHSCARTLAQPMAL